jgi:hypothetical protein
LKKKNTRYFFKSKFNIIDVFDYTFDVMVQSQKRVSQRQEEKEKKKSGEETDSLDVSTAHQAPLREYRVGKKGKALLKNKIEVFNSNKIHLPSPRNECLYISYQCSLLTPCHYS